MTEVRPKVFTFQDQLKVGNKGEALILERYPTPLTIIKEHYADFKDAEGNTYELKTDTYPLDTGNFFIERWSDTEKGRPGGPWQAMEKGANIWLYLYLKDTALFRVTRIPTFIEYLESEIIPRLRPIRVYNRGYYGSGFKVPRAAVSDYTEEVGLKNIE